MIQAYTGPGRGKSSAAAGLALRAAGAGMRVKFIRFLKDRSSEDSLLEHSGIEMEYVAPYCCFKKKINNVKIKEEIETFLEELKSGYGKLDLLVLDEILVAVKKDFLKEEKLTDFLSGKPRGLEIILSGRGLGRKTENISDLVSYIKEVKHPFNCKIRARKGFDM